MAGSPPHEQPWSEYEKIVLLVEIIKAGRPNLIHLLNLVNGLHPLPQWGDVVPPPGRTLNQCITMFNNLATSQPQLAGPQTPSPMPHSLGPVHQKRPFENILPAPREIRPKPPLDASSNQRSAPTNEPPKKKRGRPTKAEIQSRGESSQRAASMSALGGRPVEQVIAGPSTFTTPIQPIPQLPIERPPSTSHQAAEMRPPPASTTPSTDPQQIRPPVGFSISDIVTPNAPISHESSSSSGKRRRAARSTRSDPAGANNVDDTPTAAPSGPTYHGRRDDGDDQQQQQPRPSANALGKRPDFR